MLRFTPNIISRAKNRFLFHRNLHSSSFSKGSQTLETEEQSYASRLRQCTEALNTRLGKSIHAQFIKRSLLSSLYLHNHLLNMYVKCGDFDCGLNLFDEMPYRNVVSWTVVISGLVQHGYAEKGLLLFRRLHLSGVAPNEFTLVGALNACSLSGNISQAYQIFGYIVRLGFENNVFLFNAFLTALIRHCKLAAAVDVFEKCSCKDIVSWNAIIAGYLQFSYAEVPRFWVRLVSAGVKPDNFTFASVLTGLAALSDLELGLQVHAQLVKYGHGVEICVGNSLVDMYLKNHKLVDGFKAFNEMTLKDVISWTQIAAGCLLCGEPERVLGVIGQMKKEDDWAGVRTLRELMEARQVRKMPGSSWMEINGNCSLAPADGAFYQIEDLKFSVSNI
ncbi:Pentatricopeptide repeat [Dillenia turbinata]|uniref:Pentatricopeptide repeat n=1 Tax=Dillenia turbinata TaxID=194707 RepID=A0AAN8ZBJ4_9MAGN